MKIEDDKKVLNKLIGKVLHDKEAFRIKMNDNVLISTIKQNN